MSEMKLIMESWRGYQNFDLEDVLEEIDVLVEEYKEVLEKEHILSERKVTLIKESIVQKIAQLAKSAFSRVASMASSGAEKVASFLDSLVGKVGRLKSHAPGLVKFITAGAFAALVTLMPSMAQAATARRIKAQRLTLISDIRSTWVRHWANVSDGELEALRVGRSQTISDHEVTVKHAIFSGVNHRISAVDRILSRDRPDPRHDAVIKLRRSRRGTIERER